MDTLLQFLLTDFLGKPAWMWFSFIGIVITLLALACCTGKTMKSA